VIRTYTIAGISLLIAAAAHADTLWDEGSNGDLSEDRFNPTPMFLPEGLWSLYAFSGTYGENMDIWDREYFTVTMPPGTELSQLILMDYFGDDGAAFIGIQTGPIITVDPANASPTDLLGWALFGIWVEGIGVDYLPIIGRDGSGAIGFDPPLPAGQYTFWIQQMGPFCNYQWDFIVTPEPASLALACIASLIALRRR
jgi:hypothetical protein